MEKVETGDGSPTFYSEKYGETYHSKSGALEETFGKFIRPCRIKELAKTGRVRIFDICFGLGYNAIAAIDAALEENENCEIYLVSLEKELILDRLKELNPCLTHYHIIEKLQFDPINNSYTYEEKNIYLRIKIGNAKETIKTLKGSFDAVFLDPFSPKKNPELWTEEFFREIFRRMNKGSILSTYSCARIVRDNLRSAGFEVSDGPSIGRRAPSTIAKKL
ncbi:TPA: tRNA (5-methylaminomethyl-2-thiouridine)(34)-methyltransferase MnmD [Candidatus Woesearchaeota archaeon]|nr:hypothetical protein QT06_C0001G0223 [archaeon GW2011_AR15]MBS3103976.1 tRNA (5-methylaminomethyl-2-thiouridine)(34)-methyltransferase MnmD [Candidatus Woesearchaeota archaeon]HIH40956.1 tRNA (5-methylaminomethyl-2-thiouridine)(34)-methyltransferase MnmD [Candidatus Woesearchaeota archaeon]